MAVPRLKNQSRNLLAINTEEATCVRVRGLKGGGGLKTRVKKFDFRLDATIGGPEATELLSLIGIKSPHAHHNARNELF